MTAVEMLALYGSGAGEKKNLWELALRAFPRGMRGETAGAPGVGQNAAALLPEENFARAVRTLLRKNGITSGVKAVFSTEKPAAVIVEDGVSSRHIPASNAFAPAAAGLMLARETVLDLIKTDD